MSELEGDGGGGQRSKGGKRMAMQPWRGGEEGAVKGWQSIHEREEKYGLMPLEKKKKGKRCREL